MTGKRLRRPTDDETRAFLATVVSACFVVALVAVVGFTLLPGGTDATYTEFYVLGSTDTAAEYPDDVAVGETARVRIGIENHEQRRTTYTLVVRSNDTTLAVRTLTLAPDGEWVEPVELSFESPGEKRLRMELYRGETAGEEPYRWLRLSVDVDR